MKPSTVFALMYEFGSAQIEITKVGAKYFGYATEKQAKIAAAANKYPFPVCRYGNQKSGWFVEAQVLADYLDATMEKAGKEWKAAN